MTVRETTLCILLSTALRRSSRCGPSAPPACVCGVCVRVCVCVWGGGGGGGVRGWVNVGG